MLFTPGLLLAGGATLVLIAAEKTMEDLGIHWLGTALRIALPLIGMAAGVYFLENNPIVWWILK
jgi:hypothetical protein